MVEVIGGIVAMLLPLLLVPLIRRLERRPSPQEEPTQPYTGGTGLTGATRWSYPRSGEPTPTQEDADG